MLTWPPTVITAVTVLVPLNVIIRCPVVVNELPEPISDVVTSLVTVPDAGHCPALCGSTAFDVVVAASTADRVVTLPIVAVSVSCSMLAPLNMCVLVNSPLNVMSLWLLIAAVPLIPVGSVAVPLTSISVRNAASVDDVALDIDWPVESSRKYVVRKVSPFRTTGVHTKSCVELEKGQAAGSIVGAAPALGSENSARSPAVRFALVVADTSVATSSGLLDGDVVEAVSAHAPTSEAAATAASMRRFE